MTALVLLWILGILAALIVLLCLTRVGVHAVFRGGQTLVRVRVGPFRFQVYPVKEKKPKEEKPKKEKKEKAPKEKQSKDERAKPKITLADIKDAVRTLWPPLKRALGRTRRGIRVAPLDLSVTVGGQADPAAAAERYGDLHAAVWTVMPALEQVLDIRNPRIHVGIDFDAPGTEVSGEAGISIRIGTLLGVGLGVGIPALKWFLAFRKKQKKQQPPASEQKEPEQAEQTAA
ncbi:hypothetical protein [Dysosmobacter sp.]|uniref:hypothetical protein n=1 Tax=Dysosmobacter sp. TaxID=2591382 RepID=UPI002A8FEBB1|nr:hypothetical protein [Dysosmobacter sp.]MDY3984795.1 hypothetical protein [Dysosmobacter sp.]